MPPDSVNEHLFLLNISQLTPLDWAVPLYGYLMPVLVLITTATNSFIMLVLSRRHLRTPTNFVLLAMAATDLLTGVISVPWFLYYYTFKGYIDDQDNGISTFWCQAHAILFEVLPSAFHTAATWLTVFLAIQRYSYVCMPRSMHIYCTPRIAKICICVIISLAFVSVLPEVITKRRVSMFSQRYQRNYCYVLVPKWINDIGRDIFNSIYFWVRVAMHTIPCLLLLIFTYKLAQTLREAEVRKKSWALIEPPRKFGMSGRSTGMTSSRSLYATNRMLAVICSVFLLLEIPAALLYGMQFLMAMSFVDNSPESILIFNRILVARNLLIVLTSPILFGIYCSMSEQFRLTVRQLFSSRLLFVAQAQATFHGGKRYSLILVNIDGNEQVKKLSLRHRLSSFLCRRHNYEQHLTDVSLHRLTTSSRSLRSERTHRARSSSERTSPRTARITASDRAISEDPTIETTTHITSISL